METTAVFPRLYKFGPFELSVEAAELRKNGVRLKLQDQPFQILCTLLEHPGELVPRERLRQQLWPEGTFVDFEHGLNTAIKKLRDVLSDDAETPRYVETIPRKGYRFIANVSRDTDQAIPAPPSSRPRWQSRVFFLIAALIVVIGIVVLVLRGLSYPPSLRISATRQLTFNADLMSYSVTISTIETDGRRVYYFKHNDGRLYSVPVGGGAESSSATRFSQPVILHISPDGSTLLVKEVIGRSGGYPDRIWLLPTSGTPARPLGDIEAEFAAWSPDGRAIAFAQQNAIYVTEDEGATYHRLADTLGTVSWIRWSPDGQRLRFSVSDSKTLVSSMWETRSNGKTRPVAMKLGAARDTCCGIWTRDGRRFLFRQLRDQRTDYWTIGESWWPFRSREPFPLSGGGLEVIAATSSPLDDRLFVVGNEVSRMTYKFDLGRRQLTPFLPELSVTNPVFSPDSKWMLLCQMHTRERVLWRARSDGSEWLQLTDPKLWVHHARYSPDGKRIALMGKFPDRPWKIYWISAEGGALHELNVRIASQADPNWTPDGQSIVFGQPPLYYAEPDTPRAIYSYNLQTSSTSKIPGSEGWFSPRISPDGRSFLALSIDEHKLAVYNFADSRWRVLVDNLRERFEVPSWSPDGESAFVNSLYGKNNSLFRIRIREGIMEEVLSFHKLIASPECWAWGFGEGASLMISCVRPNSNIYALRYE
jgi:Tol biopolymer transport system component/DNA-binding winged helix-turn-helix (wHTH) protein